MAEGLAFTFRLTRSRYVGLVQRRLAPKPNSEILTVRSMAPVAMNGDGNDAGQQQASSILGAEQLPL